MKFINIGSDSFISAFHEKAIVRLIIYIRHNLMRLELLAMVSAALLVSTKIPYFNLVVSLPVVAFVIILLATVLLRVPLSRNSWIIPVCFALSCVATLVRLNTVAEYIGNMIYFLLWIIVVDKIHTIWKEK